MNAKDAGNPIRQTVGVVERIDLTLFRMWGRDPVRMLNGLITNDLSRATVHRAVYAAMLTPKGKMLSDLRAFTTTVASGTEVLLAVPTAAAATVEAHLRKFIPPLFAKWERTDWRVIGAYGPRAADTVQSAFGLGSGARTDEDDVTLIAGDEDDGDDGLAAAIVATADAGGEPGFDIFIPPDRFEGARRLLLDAAGGQGGEEADLPAFDLARIEAGRPRYGVDMTEATLPGEAFESTGLMERAVSFTKGCYTGQEVVVRIAHRGHVNRHLRGVLLGDAPVPAAGTAIVHPDTGKEIGATTSAAVSELVGQTIVLAWIRREAGPGDRVVVGEVTGTIAELPFRAA